MPAAILVVVCASGVAKLAEEGRSIFLDLLCRNIQEEHMAGAEFDLARMLSPMELDRFFSDYWEQRPLVLSRNQPDFYAGLFSQSDADYIISSTDLRHPAIRLVKQGAEIPLSHYTTDVPWSKDVFRAVADVTKVLAEYRRGATIVLQALHRSWPPVARFCRTLETHFTYPLQTNIYLTPPSAQGFAPHYDTHEVFVLQIAGSKHWRVYGSPIPLPDHSLPSGSVRVDIGTPMHEIDLQPGDLLYLPRGYIHEALTSAAESLHVTVGIPTLTWIDVLSEAIALCRQDVRFRKAVPIGFATQDQVSNAAHAHFDELLTVFSERTQLDVVMGRLAERFITSRSPVLESPLLGLPAGDQLDVQTLVRKRPGLIHRLIVNDQSMRLLFPGKTLTFPTYGEPLLRFILEMDAFNVASMPGTIDVAEKLGLVRRLLQEGFLTTVHETP